MTMKINDKIAELAAENELNETAFRVFMANAATPHDIEDEVEHFQDVFVGVFDSVTACGKDLIEHLGELEGVNEMIVKYFNYEQYALDLQDGGLIWASWCENELYVFLNQ